MRAVLQPQASRPIAASMSAPSARSVQQPPQFSGLFTYNGHDKTVTAKPLNVKPNPSKWLLAATRYPTALVGQMVYGIKNVQLHNLAETQALLKQGHRIILAANHPGHGDVFTSLPLSKALNTPFCTIAADWVFKMAPPFLESPWHGLLSRLGLFPVSQDLPDKEAVRNAKDVLVNGPYPLMICPEGEISWQNERLTDLRGGAASIGCEAAEALQKLNLDKKVFIIPVGIKFHFEENILPALEKKLTQLERHLDIAPSPTPKNMLSRLQTTWLSMLAKKEREFLGTDTPCTTLAEKHALVLDGIISRQEAIFGIQKPDNATPVNRVRQLFAHMKAGRPIPGHTFKNERERQAFLKKHCLEPTEFAYKLQKLAPDYLTPEASQDRMAEIFYVVNRLATGKTMQMWRLGKRSTALTLGPSINLSQMVAETDTRTARKQAMALLRDRLQALINPQVNTIKT